MIINVSYYSGLGFILEEDKNMSQAYIVLIVMAVMIVAMVSDKFDFGFAPVAACTILVLTGTATVQQAYGGFINNNTILTALVIKLFKAKI